MKAKNCNTDECYVCIISFIRSVLALTLALALALMVFVNITAITFDVGEGYASHAVR